VREKRVFSNHKKRVKRKDPPKDTFAWEYTPLIFKHGSFLKAKQQQKL